MTVIDSWLAANWSFVRRELPTAPARVMEIGCGPRGGFVPLMLDVGYDAIGVDPQAPEGRQYHRIEFEQYQVAQQVHAVVACTSLHHVADLQSVLAKVQDGLVSGAPLIVVEWDWERFDENTAQWCFTRLASSTELSGHGWLRTLKDEWVASGRPWAEYVRRWASEERLHPGHRMLSELDKQFDVRSCTRSPYFFPDLDQTSESDEQTAIDTGQILAGGIRYVGTTRACDPSPGSPRNGERTFREGGGPAVRSAALLIDTKHP
jgi:Methyltransferase domain